MRHRPTILRTPRRIVTMCCLGWYSVVGLLGSGGLHAIAPCCHVEAPETASAQASCGHHHGHSHAADGHRHGPENDSCPCPEHEPASGHDENCFVCKTMSAPLVAPTVSDAVPFWQTIATPAEPEAARPLIGAPRRVLNRGPPAVA